MSTTLPASIARRGPAPVPPAEAVAVLLWVRAALILGVCMLLGLAVLALGARLPWPQLVVLLAGHVALLGWGLARRAHGLSNQSPTRPKNDLAPSGGGPDVFSGPGAQPTQFETALHLALDAALLGGVVHLTGGYANPFISLLLVPLILGAVLLRARLAWALAGWVGLIYTLLMWHYLPLDLQVSDAVAVHLHLQGMWLNFLLTAALVAAFTGGLAAALRRRDAALAQAREQRLRDEQLFALGLQAAAAAHDLATPLASLRLTLDDLRQDYGADDELAAPLGVMAGQLQRMESVLARLAQVARARQLPLGPPMPAATWLARTVERWGLLHPTTRVVLEAPSGLPAVEDDPALEAVLITLLNNAREAAPTPIRMRARAAGGRLWVEVGDEGPGLGDKPVGWGVGVELARAALQRLGGDLALEPRADGGVQARAALPLAAPPG